MFGMNETAERGCIKEADIDFREKTAIAQAKLIVMSKTGDFMLVQAATAPDRQDFENQLIRERALAASCSRLSRNKNA
jgi:hypothetical protein